MSGTKMSGMEFMKELEYLLQDIPEEDKADALAYYRDYLDEAGSEGEADVIREFGSPERVAAIIRSDLNGDLSDGGEFTESGYQDERFRDPNTQITRRMDLPEASGNQTASNQKHGAEFRENQYYDGGHSSGAGRQNGGNDTGTGRQKDMQDRTWLKRLLKVGLLLVIISVASPLILGVGGTILGIVAGLLCLIGVCVIGIGALTVAACMAAVILLVVGVGMVFGNPGGGVLFMGAGIFTMGCGLIGIALSVLTYGTFLPFCVRGCVNVVSGLLHRTGGRKA